MIVQVALKNKAKESATILPANPKYLALSNQFGEPDMQLTGSNPKMLINLINSGLLPKDARLATRGDLEKAIKRQKDFLSGFYVDCGLNLNSIEGKDYEINSVFAEGLADDLKNVGTKLDCAKLIPYDTLTKKFRLSKKGKDIVKDYIKNTGDFKWDYKPSDSGLFRACLHWDGDWSAVREDLAYSGAGGRVVVVSGKASSQKFFDMYVSKFATKRDKIITQANQEYADKTAFLRAK